MLLRSLETEARLHAAGRVTLYERVVGSLVSRLSAQDYFRHYPEILEEEIRAPVVIVGLARTGSTMLHRLLAADPEVYSVRWWECRSPSPHPGSRWRVEDPRIAEARAEIRAILEAAPELETIHPWDAEGPDEEIMLLEHAFLSLVPEAFCRVPSYARYVSSADLRPAYAHLKRMLQFLQWQKQEAGERRARWVLKAPSHLAWIDLLCETFPDVTIVQTHRDPLETLPSLASMHAATHRTSSDRADPRAIGAADLERWSWAMARCLASRDGGQEPRFIDLSYAENLEDPMASIARIYDRIARALTPEAREAMQRWRDENRRAQRGAHAYSLEQFGLTREAICEAFADYRERFIVGRRGAS